MRRAVWILRCVDDLGEVIGGRQRSPHHTRGVRRPYLRVANVFDGFIDVSDVKEMLFTEDEFAIYELRDGDVLLNEGQSLDLVGRAAMYRGEPPVCAFQNTLIRVRPNDNTDQQFLEYLLRWLYWKGTFSRIASRTTSIAHLGSGRLARLRVRVPDKRTQGAIASAIKPFIEHGLVLDALIAKKKEFNRGLRQDLVTGRRRLPEFVNTPWKEMPIGEVLSPISRPVVWSDEDMYSLLSVRRRSRGVFLREHRRGESIKSKGLFTVAEGDFLISRMQVAHGALALVGSPFAGMHVSGTYDVLRSRDNHILNIEFFDLLTRLPIMYRRARLACHGVHIEKMTFSLRDYLKTTVHIPSSIAEQARIVACVRAMETEIQKLEQLRAALASQKRALMDRLLSGPIELTR